MKGAKNSIINLNLPILSKLHQASRELANIQSDLHEERTTWQEEEHLEDLNLFSPLDALAEGEETSPQSQEKLLYDLLKSDLEHHGQLLEHPFVIDELKKFLQRQWMDIATGGAIKFQAALAQPSLDLAENEVCVPKNRSLER